jgi:hypothetical protein
LPSNDSDARMGDWDRAVRHNRASLRRLQCPNVFVIPFK